MKNIKHMVKKGMAKMAPGFVESGRRILHMEEMMRHVQANVTELREEVNKGLGHHDSRIDQLRWLATQIEPYQPAYGVQGAIDSPQRDCHDRCLAIEHALRPIPGKRTLDIGSSFGYVSFYLADRGATAEAWDMHALNIEISQRIGDINGIGVKFRTNELTLETAKTIPAGKFDVVILLSLFHHIVRFQGLEQTQQIVKELFGRIPVMVVELARKGEDPALPWDKSQPDDELAIFDLVKDDVEIKKIGEFKNHLSEKTRPLYVIQKKKTVAVNANTYAYSYSTTEAYKDSPVSRYGLVRRYYFSDEYIVKEYVFEPSTFGDNVVQILNEVNLLLHVVAGRVHHAPELVDFEVSRERACVVIKRVEGELASDLDLKGKHQKVRKLAEDALKTLADLEKINLYHNDIRSWNLIVDAKGRGWVIDYGMAGVLKVDDDALALLWMLHAMLRGERELYRGGDSSLPDEASFTDPALRAVYKAVKKGERSPARLLAALQAAR